MRVKIKNKMNNKGWLRIAEAFIAILIVISVLVILTTRLPQEDRSENMHEIQRHLLKQVSADDMLRGEILQGTKDGTETFISNNIPLNLDFEINICEVNEVCGMETYVDKEIYADEILITSTLQQYNPKKLKLFVWVK